MARVAAIIAIEKKTNKPETQQGESYTFYKKTSSYEPHFLSMWLVSHIFRIVTQPAFHIAYLTC